MFLRTLLNAIEQESEILFFMLNMCTKIGDISRWNNAVNSKHAYAYINKASHACQSRPITNE